MLMETLLESKVPASKLSEGFTVYPQVLKNIRVTDLNAAVNDEAVKAKIAEVEEKLGTNGRVLVRKSGTEPLIRIMVEAGGEDECNTFVDEIIGTIISRGYGLS